MDNTEHVVFAIQFNIARNQQYLTSNYATKQFGWITHPLRLRTLTTNIQCTILQFFFLGRGLQYWKSTVLQTFRYLYNLVSMYNIWGELGAQWSHFFFVYNVRAGLQQVFTVNLYVFIISRYFQRRMARGHHPWWPLSTLAI